MSDLENDLEVEFELNRGEKSSVKGELGEQCAPAPQPSAPPAKSQRHTCRECGASAFCLKFFEAFNIAVCNACKVQKYSLMTKTTAKEDYLLTDSKLAGLRFLLRENPKNPNWAPMKLYLQSEVMAIGQSTFQDQDAWDQARRNKAVSQLQKRMAVAKRRKEELALEADIASAKSHPKKVYKPLAQHVHTFVEKGSKQCCCTSCGIVMEFEEF